MSFDFHVAAAEVCTGVKSGTVLSVFCELLDAIDKALMLVLGEGCSVGGWVPIALALFRVMRSLEFLRVLKCLKLRKTLRRRDLRNFCSVFLSFSEELR
jgi:hypothetical protein